MPLNYTAVNLGPIYTLMGVAAQFALASEDIIELTVLDKTGGIQIEEQGSDGCGLLKNRSIHHFHYAFLCD